MDIFSIVQNAVYFLIASGLITWLIKSIFTQYFKQEQMKFSKLHEKRALVIEEIYEALTDFEIKMNSLVRPLQWAGELSKEEKIKQAAEVGDKFANLCYKNEIYFDEKTYGLLNSINKKFHDAWIDFETKGWLEHDQIDREHYKDIMKYWNNAWNTVSKDIPELKKELKHEFRSILGVRGLQTKN